MTAKTQDKKPADKAVADDTNVANFAEAAERKGKIRVRLPSSVNYEGEDIDQLWMRRPTVLDGIVASNQAGDSNNKILFGMVAQCVGVDMDWLWEQSAAVANKLVKAYTDELKDPVHLPEWDGLTLTLFKPLTVKDKTLDSLTLSEPTTRDLMDDSSREKVYEMVARLLGLSVSNIRDMDYLHDYSELVAKVNSFRDA